ncbi:hypothetical protein PYW07_003299 [Mythimna separata]|uniref:Peptidase aspartic putative domain-containing protein n=1 Tax=Mythimna separata TaxID=271217 RepID=A0AAD7YHP2_MYTSE|nr:hypothetical protein PYW07_003299 [Mythimna separata]
MEAKTLIKRCASYKAKLTLFENYLQTVESCDSLSRLQINELNVRLSKIEEIYTDFDSIQCDIENSMEIPDEQYKEREAFETKYFGTVARARDLLAPAAGVVGSARSGTGSCCTALEGGPKLALPTIHLPSFSGQYHDWLEFRDTFSSLIHLDKSIPNINKFHYLRAALKDSAAVVIQSLEFSSDNYEVAWELLCDRYNNKRSLVNNHIQAIFNLEQLAKESSKSLRNLIDTVNRNLRALKKLNLPTEHWDILLIQIISNKLDTDTSVKWESYRNKLKELPTLKIFNDFLKDRADFLETMDNAHKKRRSSDTTHVRHKTYVANASSPPVRKYACPYCKGTHALYVCQKFKSLSLGTRLDTAKVLKLCLNCLRQGHADDACKFGPCRSCGLRRNSLLHEHAAPAPSSPVPSTSNVMLHALPQPGVDGQPPSPPQDIALSTIQNNCVLLSTALIHVTDINGDCHKIRAMLDSGSTSSFLTETLCAKLKLPTSSTSTVVEGLNSQISCLTKRCDVLISSLLNNYSESVSCLVVPRITQLLPTTKVDYTILNIPPHITLADPNFYIPAPIDMLLGADIFWTILGSQNISLGKNKPTLNKSKLGFLISGPVPTQHTKFINTVHCNHLTLQNNEDQLYNQLSKFFELETVTTHKQISKEELECEQSFIENTIRLPDGRFEVTIPLKDSPDKLGDSYEQALSRFLSLERRFKREPHFKEQYCNFIKEYISLNHMSLNESPGNDAHTYILPHHGVLRDSSLSTKLRVVFDASAVTTSGVSFNQLQMVGATVQDDLISILIRMRQHRFLVTADVEKMYRMVNVKPSQQTLQQILWRFEPHEQLRQYKLHTVTYGTASAPYLATRCLTQLGNECADQTVSEVILHDFYCTVREW